jgi:manganese transport protein
MPTSFRSSADRTQAAGPLILWVPGRDAGRGPRPATGVPSALDWLLARGRVRGALAMLGPAFVTSVAYVDPGNFATNIQGGAEYGYRLLWVVLVAMATDVAEFLGAAIGLNLLFGVPMLPAGLITGLITSAVLGLVPGLDGADQGPCSQPR